MKNIDKDKNNGQIQKNEDISIQKNEDISGTVENEEKIQIKE